MTHAYRVLCVPPLMARDPLTSHGLYKENVREALGRVAPEVEVEILPLPSASSTGGLVAKLENKRHQLRVLPRLLQARLRELAGRPVVLHLLDQHYAYLRANHLPSVLTCNGVFRKPRLLPHAARYAYRTRRLPEADRIVAVSHDTKADLETIFGLAPDRIAVCHYGVDAVFRPDAPKAEIPGRGASLLVLHVGSNIPQKNVPTLLRGIRAALDRGLDVKLVKVGDPVTSSPFAKLLDTLDLRARLIELGKLGPRDLAGVYNACDVFSFPSSYEGFGRPIAEAQACGLPCVLAAASCLPEIGGAGARYHATHDEAALSSQILTLARSPELREASRKLGLENARRFSWDRHAEGLLTAYEAARRRFAARRNVGGGGRLSEQ